jgi:polyhydroxybutyrate depolymerase
MNSVLVWILRVLLGLLVLALAAVLVAWVAFRLWNRTNGSLVSSGRTRDYLLYVPESYDPSKPVPLVISLHGFAQWPAHQSGLTHWTELADQYGFIVVHPSGTGFPKRWRMQIRGGSETSPSADVIFISDLINKLEAEYNIDPQRVYVNGLSNGGGMTAVLACELSGRIAAVGSVAGAYTFAWGDCPSARPMPAIIFHGTADPIVPFQGGVAGGGRFTFPPVQSWVEGLARHNGCEGQPLGLPASGDVSGIRFEGCAEDADVVFYTIAGGGHSWPGGGYLPKLIVGHTSRDIDATKTMWEFFQRHPLPGAK